MVRLLNVAGCSYSPRCTHNLLCKHYTAQCWFTCRFREKAAMASAKEKHRDAMERFIALQFLFDKQWKAVKARMPRPLCA